MIETIKNRGWFEQGDGDLPVFIVYPLPLEPFAPNK